MLVFNFRNPSAAYSNWLAIVPDARECAILDIYGGGGRILEDTDEQINVGSFCVRSTASGGGG